MKARYPTFDYSDFRVHWGKTIEFSQRYNSSSTIPAHIEPYLVKVMIKARKLLGEDQKDIRDEVDIFIRQENQHCKQHLTFNKMLHENGYEGMIPLEDAYKADYEKYLATKSVKFNLAYSEGFEAIGSMSAELLFGDMKDFWDEAETDAAELWRWHLAEEFEHRETCFKLFKELYCKGFLNTIINGYFYRVFMFIYSTVHIGRHNKRVMAYLLEVDRKNMTQEEREESIKREKALNKRELKASWRKLLKVLSPFYDPGKKKVPDGLEDYLEQVPDVRPA